MNLTKHERIQVLEIINLTEKHNKKSQSMERNVTFNNGNIQYPEGFILLKCNFSDNLNQSLSREYFFGEVCQTDPKIHVEDTMGKNEMFLKKNNNRALPGISRERGSLECAIVWCWHKKQNSCGARRRPV